MKKQLLLQLAAISIVGTAQAQSLRFTSGEIFNTNQVSLWVSGPSVTNLNYVLERLDLTNQTWQTVSTYTINSGGPTNLTSSLFNGTYGFFRTRSPNHAYLSTNAFGAIVGSVGPGLSLLGNPFGATTITNIFPNPAEGSSVEKWNNSTTNYVVSNFSFGTWDTNFTIGEVEGFFIDNGGTNAMAYQFSGLFTTNTVTKLVPTGFSIITSPSYYLITPPTLWNDTLTNNVLGGKFSIPVQTPGYSPQSEVDKWIAATNGYAKYYLTNLVTTNFVGTNSWRQTNLVWTLSGTNVYVPLYLGEGFFINKPTNATWSFNRPIW